MFIAYLSDIQTQQNVYAICNLNYQPLLITTSLTTVISKFHSYFN